MKRNGKNMLKVKVLKIMEMWPLTLTLGNTTHTHDVENVCLPSIKHTVNEINSFPYPGFRLPIPNTSCTLVIAIWFDNIGFVITLVLISVFRKIVCSGS